ncbi:MAG: methyltransferase domain-containing protein [Pseudomonadota bacterium]
MIDLTFLVLVVVGFALVFVLWRLASRRRELPCPSWLAWMVELDNPFTKVNRAKFIVEHLALTPGMKVLDAGCGPGRLTLPLAEAVGPEGEVTALDLQAGMLDRVREKVTLAGLSNVRYLHAGLGEGKLQDLRYDRITLVTVLGEIPDQNAALKELHRALRPEGLLSITEVIFDPHFQSYKSLLRLATETGFEEVSFFGRRLAYTVHLKKSAEH